MIDFRLGRWQDREAETVDCIICDPPYSARTHSGHSSVVASVNDPRNKLNLRNASRIGHRRDLNAYDPLTADDVAECSAMFARAAKGWIVVMTDHTLWPEWEKCLKAAGRYVFHPIPCVIPGMTVRLAGDGPASWCVWLCVARPKGMMRGSLPGAYVCSKDSTTDAAGRESRIGGKPLSLMSQIVRDYSREGDTVYDPFAGHATTGVAALQLGRRFVGDECDAAAHAAGLARLQRVVAQPSLFEARTKTGDLFDSP